MNKGRANEMDKSIAKRIKTARLLQGLSQQQVASALDISIQQVQKYETGTNRISSGRLHYLSEFLKLPITYFFDQSHYKSNLVDQFSNNNFSEKEIVTLIRSFNLVKNVKLKNICLTLCS